MWAETESCFSTEKGIYTECNLHLSGFYSEFTPSRLSASWLDTNTTLRFNWFEGFRGQFVEDKFCKK